VGDQDNENVPKMYMNKSLSETVKQQGYRIEKAREMRNAPLPDLAIEEGVAILLFGDK
jgi:hypothetical protein